MSEPKTYGERLAVVVVTYFPGETLECFLDTLAEASTCDVEVVIADNGSTDGAPDKAVERDNVRLLRMGDNLGYGAAANRGVAELDASFGWVVIANADLEWHPGGLDTLLDVATRWPRGAAFGPLIREPDGSVYPSARLLPSLGRGIGHAVFGKIWPRNPWTRAYRQQDSAPTERMAGWLSGSCQLVRRQAFDAVGGFDPRYFMYFEDVDLGERLGRAGWQNVYAPTAEVLHLGGHATARAPSRMLEAHHASAYRYLADRHRGWRWAPVLGVLKAGLAVRLRLETRRGRHG